MLPQWLLNVVFQAHFVHRGACWGSLCSAISCGTRLPSCRSKLHYVTRINVHEIFRSVLIRVFWSCFQTKVMLLAPPSKSVPKVSSTPRSNQEIVTSQEPPQNMPQVPRRPLQQPKVLEPKAALLLGHHQVPPVASPKVCTTSVSSYTAFLLPCKQINQSFILYIIVILVHISVLFVFYFFLSFIFPV